MSFHDVQLPTGISRGAVGGPRYGTTIQTTASGHEYRVTRQAAARRTYDFSKEGLTPSQWSALLDFAASRRGHLHSFRFKDWTDYSTAVDGTAAPAATDQVIGTGDGSEVQFQLFKTRDYSGL